MPKKKLSKIAKEFNVGISTIVDFLKKKGYDNIESNPNTKIEDECYDLLQKEYSKDITLKKESEKVNLKKHRAPKESFSIKDIKKEEEEEENEEDPVKEEQEKVLIVKDATGKKKKNENKPSDKINKPKILGKIDLNNLNKGGKKKEVEKKEPSQKTEIKEEVKQEIEQQEQEQEQEQETKQSANIKEEELKTEEKNEEKSEKLSDKTEEVIKNEENITQDESSQNQNDDTENVQDHEDNFINDRDNYKIDSDVKVIGKIDLDSINQRTRPRKKTKEQRNKERKEKIKQRKLQQEEARKKGQEKNQKDTTQFPDNKRKLVKIKKKNEEDDNKKKNLVASSSDDPHKKSKFKKRNKRERTENNNDQSSFSDRKEGLHRNLRKKSKQLKRPQRQEVNDEDVQKQIKETLARLTSSGKHKKGVKYRQEKRKQISQRKIEAEEKKQKEQKVLKVTEFVSVSELATMMNKQATEVIAKCMELGLFVTINQRLDAETLSLVADEFGYEVKFISVDVQEAIQEDPDKEEDLVFRPPIVTVMGHVDHGKTSLLDYIRNANVIGGEAGGITQHIGAYAVELQDKKQITFLDTPGHEAFTAMRARGAQVTDIAIIIIAADDSVNKQTIEAINHAHAAGVPIIFAINKIDKPESNPDKILEQLANINFMVEEWGGKYQSQNISAKFGKNVSDLLEKVLLEAEMLDLKANPNKKASGVVIESELDEGRGYVSTLLVQSGTLTIGDIMLAGTCSGRVKAMYNERGKRIDSAGPAIPVQVLGLDGAPQAGDKFNVMDTDREARDVANKRQQLQREQGLRTQKYITLDEIGRRIAIGNFQELNIIIKADVDGSVEALADSLSKLSTESIQVKIIHRAVGQIAETDVMLAAASNAIIVGFQVRPSLAARKLAEKEGIDIRIYSIIYDAINEIKDAMEGMLAPVIKEQITGTAEIKETFKISKVGTIAGCIVKEGKITRNSKVRLIRDGIVAYTGNLESLRRFKDEAKEVLNGQECGLNIEHFNDIKVGDIVEAFEEIEVKQKL